MKQWYSPNEAGAILGFSGQTIRNWCQSQQLNYTISPTGRYRIPRESLQQWLKNNSIEPKERRSVEELLAL